MDSIRTTVYLGACVLMLSTVCWAHITLDHRLAMTEQQLDTKDMAEALESLLEGDEDNQAGLDKRASIIPRCDVGERCAMKHGPRIGRLCDCMRGSACNTFFLRCY
ncbi:Cocaine- and amphetamine-regulated transcript protein [Bagarius yarrelli]|uniref:Cocaine-and amphetamine-regulated transcript protein n=1 Tax=Bagarius yarrelli TaxID=175774 RepID=A0A556TPF7_BAGYA|nr:Cocaine- and amphetamine-regulated transcript protein [Bagarius yarrelli]